MNFLKGKGKRMILQGCNRFSWFHIQVLVLLIVLQCGIATDISDSNSIKEAIKNIKATEVYDQNIDFVVGKYLDYYNDHLVTSIVKDIYSKSADNVQEILKYVNEIPSLYQRGLGYKALLAEMERNGKLNTPDIFTIAFWIKQTLDLFEFKGVLPCLPQKTKVLFEDLKDRLPTLIRYIFWDKVCLRNWHFKEYVYAAGDSFLYDNVSRSVYTWKQVEPINIQGWWKFYPEQEGTYFKIHIPHYDEYLQASGDDKAYSPDRANMFTVKKDILNYLHLWKINIYNLEKNTITIFANNGTEYVYSAEISKDDDRRYLFAWRGEDKTFYPNSVWEIESC